MRGALVPPDVPLHRTRAQRFDDLVLEAVARLEPRWEDQLAQVEFAVEEIPPSDADPASGGVPLGRLDPGSPPSGPAGQARGEAWPRGKAWPHREARPDAGTGGRAGGSGVAGTPGAGGTPDRRGNGTRGDARGGAPGGSAAGGGAGGPAGGGAGGGARGPAGGGAAAGGARGTAAGAPARPPRIVVYRQPLLARADGEEELGELVFEVVVEEFARLLGVDPEDVDPDYSPED